jgi:nucleoside-diphosphate-sugar epimerase
MHILVTGGAGFIGSHLCDRLSECGDKVWCVDNQRLGRRSKIARQSSPGFHLGDGTQSKRYLYVGDLIGAI